VVVTRLMERLGSGLDLNDPSIGAMAIYPHYAHALAAAVGSLVNSPVLGMHFVSLVAVLLVWSSWAWAASAREHMPYTSTSSSLNCRGGRCSWLE
jgi:hypothetical protein